MNTIPSVKQVQYSYKTNNTSQSLKKEYNSDKAQLAISFYGKGDFQVLAKLGEFFKPRFIPNIEQNNLDKAYKINSKMADKLNRSFRVFSGSSRTHEYTPTMILRIIEENTRGQESADNLLTLFKNRIDSYIEPDKVDKLVSYYREHNAELQRYLDYTGKPKEYNLPDTHTLIELGEKDKNLLDNLMKMKYKTSEISEIFNYEDNKDFLLEILKSGKEELWYIERVLGLKNVMNPILDEMKDNNQKLDFIKNIISQTGDIGTGIIDVVKRMIADGRMPKKPEMINNDFAWMAKLYDTYPNQTITDKGIDRVLDHVHNRRFDMLSDLYAKYSIPGPLSTY